MKRGSASIAHITNSIARKHILYRVYKYSKLTIIERL